MNFLIKRMPNKEKKFIGVNISDRSIEIVEAGNENGKIIIKNFSRGKLEPGIIENGRITNTNKLAVVFNSILKNAKPGEIIAESVIFSIPDSCVFIKSFLLDLDDKNINEEIEDKLVSSIPIPKKELFYVYRKKKAQEHEITGNREQIICAAISRNALNEWEDFFQKQNIEVRTILLEPIGSFFGLYDSWPREPVALVDIGSRTTKVAIFNNGGLVDTWLQFKAGDFVNKHIANKLGKEIKEVENIKKEIDLSENQNDDVVMATNEALKLIFQEVFKNIKNYNEKENPVKEIIIIGGTSVIKGIDKFLNNLESKYKLTLGKQIALKIDPIYLSAFGLAKLGEESRITDNDIFAITKGARDTNKELIRAIKFAWKNILKKYITTRARWMLVGGLIITISAIGLNLLSNKREPINKIEYKYNYEIEAETKITLDDKSIDSYRKVETEIKTAKNLEQARKEAMELARKQIRTNEVLWDQPINSPADKDNLIFPLVFDWLIYNKAWFNNEITNQTNTKIDQSNSAISDIKAIEIIKQDSQVYTIKGNVIVLSNSIIKPEQGPANEKQEEEKAQKKVRIRQLNQSLNVRSGPGTSNAVVGKAVAGKTYDLLSQEGGWWQIELSEGINGWIYANFAQLLE